MTYNVFGGTLNIAQLNSTYVQLQASARMSENVSWNSVVCLLHCRGVSKSVVHLSNGSQTHYDVLGVTPSATKTQIRDAFLLLSKQVPHTSHTLLQYSIIQKTFVMPTVKMRMHSTVINQTTLGYS